MAFCAQWNRVCVIFFNSLFTSLEWLFVHDRWFIFFCWGCTYIHFFNQKNKCFVFMSSHLSLTKTCNSSFLCDCWRLILRCMHVIEVTILIVVLLDDIHILLLHLYLVNINDKNVLMWLWCSSIKNI